MSGHTILACSFVSSSRTPSILGHYTIDTLMSEGLLCPVIPGLWEWIGQYDRVRGVSFERRDPADFIV